MRTRGSEKKDKYHPGSHRHPAGLLTSVLFRKFPMANRVARMQRSVLFFSSWSIPSFRSCRGSATSCKKTREQSGKKRLLHLACTEVKWSDLLKYLVYINVCSALLLLPSLIDCVLCDVTKGTQTPTLKKKLRSLLPFKIHSKLAFF